MSHQNQTTHPPAENAVSPKADTAGIESRLSEQTPTSWKPPHHRLSAKLVALLVGAMMLIFGLLGLVNVRLHRRDLETATLASAERVSDIIKRSTSYHMMRNDREAVYQIIQTIGAEPGMVRVRIFDKQGQITYSSDTGEINRRVDMRAEACYACHAQAQPLAKLNRPDRFRIYRSNGGRVLGVINPIENQPSCSNAACHAHPASKQILGVLDTNISLARADANLRASTRLMAIYTLIAVAGISILTWIFVWRLVHRPVKALTAATHRLREGDLGHQITVKSDDEIGELADSFNLMSLRLREANEEITTWARTLEERVEQKTGELKKAHEHILRVEKMASIGKLAAVVAHEVNNPLSGILTYAKLVRKWIENGDLERNPERALEAKQCLELIATESRRCGDLVRNLLTFSRVAPMNLTWVDLNPVIERCLKLVEHQMEMGGIQWQADLDPDMPQAHCDGAQIEQVLLALIMNAIDAMPRGGNLTVVSRYLQQSRQIELQVRDDGMGIAPEVLPRLFEPFMTTKETGKGVGLGLAISKSIVERHRGQIVVDSEPGRGTCFRILLPVDAATSIDQAAEEVKKAGAGRIG